MPHTLAHRIRRLRHRRGWTLGRLAEAARCSKAYLSGIENARHPNPPSRRVLLALEAALGAEAGELTRPADWQATPESVKAEYRRLADRLDDAPRRRPDGTVNLDALFRAGGLHDAAGEEPRASTRTEWDGRPGRQRAAGASRHGGDILPAPTFAVPLINQVAAGYPSDFTDLDYPASAADEYVSCPGLNDPDAFAARVVGESMTPDYQPGDVVIFSPAAPVRDGDDCLARVLPDHQTTFKRAFLEGGDRVRLEPLNPAFEPRTLGRDQLSGLYPAVYRLQRLGRRSGS